MITEAKMLPKMPNTARVVCKMPSTQNEMASKKRTSSAEYSGQWRLSSIGSRLLLFSSIFQRYVHRNSRWSKLFMLTIIIIRGFRHKFEKIDSSSAYFRIYFRLFSIFFLAHKSLLCPCPIPVRSHSYVGEAKPHPKAIIDPAFFFGWTGRLYFFDSQMIYHVIHYLQISLVSLIQAKLCMDICG